MRKAVLIPVIAAVVVCALLLGLFLSMNASLQSARLALAERNLSDWNELAVMTLHIENMLKVEPVDPEAVAIKQNTALYAISYDLEPAFPDHFLTTVYDQFLQDTLAVYKGGGRIEDRLALYKEANADLRALCTDVLDLMGNDNKAKLALMDEKSELYATASGKIKAFCEKYQEKF